MPRRDDLHSICLIGSGPIVIGQACEFDYAGCQALKVLREEGYRTIVVNSNPATIMTDPGFADATYLEPLDVEGVAAVLRRERPDALLPTMGGQTALNLARELGAAGILDELGIELIGAGLDVIDRAEDRELFKLAVESCGLAVAASTIVTRPEQAEGIATPAVVRPAFTLGGHGGGFAATAEELRRQVAIGLSESPIGQVLVEESLRGWDEFELEVVRDRADNVVIVCSIENLDPMGVHTGDSVTVAPQMTLPDEAYQELRDAAVAIVRAVGVDTGGSNIQFARQRGSGEIRVIEMNPRVSRSSALASKATGYPIAKVAARLAVGYTLDEIPNDLTGTTPASFEPTLDYVVVKVPRFAFEKFPGRLPHARDADEVGGRVDGHRPHVPRGLREGVPRPRDRARLAPGRSSSLVCARARRPGLRARRGSGAGRVPPCRLVCRRGGGGLQLLLLDPRRARRAAARPRPVGRDPRQRAEPDRPGDRVRLLLRPRGRQLPRPGLRGSDGELQPGDRLDRLRHLATGSTSSRSTRRQSSTCSPASSRSASASSSAGQTPLKLARAIEQAGYRILGTPFDAVDLAEDRERFGRLAASLGVRCPDWGIAESGEEAAVIAARIGYPVLVRPSYVLGGRAMRVCYDETDLREAMAAVEGAVLVDCFLENAVELDVDALCDGTNTYVAAVMEHVEEAGIHSGDSSCVLPAPSDSEEIRGVVRRLGPALGVVGLLNVQLAIHAGQVYVLEVNPRASRTVPFASKATGINLVDAACRLAAGASLDSLDLPAEGSACPGHHVKAAVLPFVRFAGADPVLGPEMRSTGEVMASGRDLATAFAKAERAAGRTLPAGGRAFLSVRDADKVGVLPVAQALAALGFSLVATEGTSAALEVAGIAVERVGKGDTVVELIRRRGVDLVVNTPQGRNARRDGYAIREAAVVARVPCITTLAVARAAVDAIAHGRVEEPVSLQERQAGGEELLRAAS